MNDSTWRFEEFRFLGYSILLKLWQQYTD